MTAQRSIQIVSLGCSKNLVDSERLMARLQRVGWTLVDAPGRRKPIDAVVVNTCGFIGDAKEESINTILELAQQKQMGHYRRLIVMGCLAERYRADLLQELPEVDAWYGKFDWEKMISDLERRDIPLSGEALYDRVLTTPPHHAYLKISEGCNRMCAFCAIPLITGRHRSRPLDELLAEARMLAARGVKELNVIAQDLSAYGTDIGTDTAALVDRLADIDGIRRIRLHYAYPTHFPMALLDVIARRDNVCRYLDIALQHASDNMLSAMRRHITAAEQDALIAEIRRRVPGIRLRTTMMVGFPGETEEDFEQLLAFVRRHRFERLGAFAYSEEEGTYAARHLKDDVPEEVKQQRLDHLMVLQESIAAEQQQALVGQTLQVVIDREEPDYYVGRTEWDSPEVDPEVLVEKSKPLTIGQYYDIAISRAEPFELFGAPV